MQLKKYILFFLTLPLFFLLSGCGPIYNSSYSFEQPKTFSGKQCSNTCLQNRTSCQMQCNTQNESCRSNARQAALAAYVLYVANKEEQQKNPHKTIDDFADYSNCNSSCGCEETYNQCFSNCGGIITENRQCVAFCGKVPPNQLMHINRGY
jgi:hypothetical protein